MFDFSRYPAPIEIVRSDRPRKEQKRTGARPPIQLSPCEIFDCTWRGHCREQRVACRSFARYVKGSKVETPTIPTAKWFNRIFREQESED